MDTLFHKKFLIPTNSETRGVRPMSLSEQEEQEEQQDNTFLLWYWIVLCIYMRGLQVIIWLWCVLGPFKYVIFNILRHYIIEHSDLGNIEECTFILQE